MPNGVPVVIKPETKKRLDGAKRPGQSYDGVIQDLLTAQGK